MAMQVRSSCQWKGMGRVLHGPQRIPEDETNRVCNLGYSWAGDGYEANPLPCHDLGSKDTNPTVGSGEGQWLLGSRQP